ncbi:MAG: LysM peptidoglycan-binding domain-containing protein [Nanoarchaeota archaeon]|nr:LysM peptidoglycan-binding domain-containing protein [Nanoarchaeota archaeon]
MRKSLKNKLIDTAKKVGKTLLVGGIATAPFTPAFSQERQALENTQFYQGEGSISSSDYPYYEPTKELNGVEYILNEWGGERYITPEREINTALSEGSKEAQWKEKYVLRKVGKNQDSIQIENDNTRRNYTTKKIENAMHSKRHKKNRNSKEEILPEGVKTEKDFPFGNYKTNILWGDQEYLVLGIQNDNNSKTLELYFIKRDGISWTIDQSTGNIWVKNTKYGIERPFLVEGENKTNSIYSPQKGNLNSLDMYDFLNRKPFGTSNGNNSSTKSVNRTKEKTYDARKGDNLIGIAKSYGVNPKSKEFKDFLDLNEITNPNEIIAGKTYKIPPSWKK